MFHKRKEKFSLVTDMTYHIQVAEDAFSDTCFTDSCKKVNYVSGFNFNVDSMGLITIINPSMSAAAKCNKLNFNHKRIYVNPDVISNGSPLTIVNGNDTINIKNGKWVKFVYLTANVLKDENNHSYYIVPH